MLKKNAFFSPRFLLPMAAVSLLAGAFLFYYFLFVSQQEASLDDRAFRTLALLSNQIGEVTGNYGNLLELSVRQTASPGMVRRSPGADRATEQFLSWQVPGLKLVSSQEDPSCAHHPVRAVAATPILSMMTVFKTGGSQLEWTYHGWCADVDVASAISPLIQSIPSEQFDDILLLNGNAMVLYQTERQGIVANDVSTWFTPSGPSEPKSSNNTKGQNKDDSTTAKPKNGADQKPTTGLNRSQPPEPSGLSQFSSLAHVNIAGSEYRVYEVPVPIIAGQSEISSKPGTSTLLLCGLIREGRFRSSSRSLPGVALTTFLLGLLLVVVSSWPVLKFATMRRSERVPARAGLYYSLSAAASIVLVFVLVIHVCYVFHDPETDDNLAQLANAIDSHVGQELKQLLRTMRSVRESKSFHEARTANIADQACSAEQSTHPLNTRINLLSAGDLQLAEYPYFYRFYAYDGQGNEQLSWTIDPHLPPSLRVCNRPYFTQTMEDQLWYLSDQGLGGDRFRIDPLYSKLTGEYLAVVTERVLPGDRAPSSFKVVTMVTPLLSLIRPVLPPDYGFALVDETGRVLFHSDVAKDGRENFLDESGNSDALRAAIAVRHQQFIDATYLGSPHRLFIRPITSIQPYRWYLITFADGSILATERVERVLLFCGLVLIYFIIVLIPFSFLLLFWRRDNLFWIWPTNEKRGHYVHLSLTLCIVTVLLYALIFHSGPKELLMFSVLIPILSVIMVCRKLNDENRWITGMSLVGMMLVFIYCRVWSPASQTCFSALSICILFLLLASEPVTAFLSRKSRSLSASFSFCAFCLLLLTAGIPSIAFFKTAYDFEENVSTRREQVLTMAALEGREQRLIQQYERVSLPPGRDGDGDNLGNWLFLRRRLEEEKLDVYASVFRDQAAGQIVEPKLRAGDSKYSQDSKDSPGILVWLASLLPRRGGSVTHQLSEGQPAYSAWIWRNEGTNRIRMEQTYNSVSLVGTQGSPQTRALAKLAFNDPVFLTHDLAFNLDLLRPKELFETVAVWLIPLLLTMFLSVRSTLRRMFLLKDGPISPWDSMTASQAVDEPGNFILVGLPCCGKTSALDEHKSAIVTVDMALAFTNRAFLDLGDISKPVAFDHFEFRMDDEEASVWKLDMLETAIRQGRKVIIVTTIDPEYWIEAAQRPNKSKTTGGVSDNLLDRWRRVLSMFTRKRFGPCEPRLGKAFQHFVWRSCTTDEQLAFYGLANDGWVNHKNLAALRHLWLRGLLGRNPMFLLTDQTADMRNYVGETVTPEQVAVWHSEETGVWEGLKFMFLVLILGAIGAVLFFFQHDFLAYFASGLTAIMPLAKLVSDTRTGRKESAAISA